MSRVYFHSPSGTAELMGSEHHYLRSLVYDLAVGLLKVDDYEHARRLRSLISPGHHHADSKFEGHDFMAWGRHFETCFRTAGDGERDSLIEWRGQPISAFSLALNTAAQLGGDAVKLATRIVGQGEIHAWADGPNRAWLADVMQAGLDAGVFRKGLWFEPAGGGQKWSDQGWGGVIAFLRARDDEPVVTSYSVTGGFPSQEGAGWGLADDGEYDWQAWEQLDSLERWRLGMDALRQSTGGLEIKPDDWESFRFTHQLSVLDLFAHDWEQSLDAAVERMGRPAVPAAE